MQPISQSYGITSANGKTCHGNSQRFDTIADVLDYAEETGLPADGEGVITGTSWPGLVIRVARI